MVNAQEDLVVHVSDVDWFGRGNEDFLLGRGKGIAEKASEFGFLVLCHCLEGSFGPPCHCADVAIDLGPFPFVHGCWVDWGLGLCIVAVAWVVVGVALVFCHNVDGVRVGVLLLVGGNQCLA